MRKLFYVFMVLCVSFQMKAQTVVDIVVASPDHTTLEAAVIAAELADDLSGPGPFTLFAPTDAAFAALPAGTVDALLQDPTGELANILLYHVLGLEALSTDLVDGMMVTTLQGEEITVTINANGVFINDAQVTVADISATNGVVHVIDAVLLPPVMPTNTIMAIVTNSEVHNTLEAALVASGLDATLSTPGSFTLFAPTDAAFALLPAGTVDALLADPTGELVNVLLYHVLSGTVLSTDLVDGMMAMTIQGSDVTVTINANGVFINNAQVIVADVMADNGVVHVIDAVLLPPAQTSTVLDIILNSPDHTTLETAVVAAGLQETLSGPGPFTVFAPTDAAFAALPAGTVEALLGDPTGALTEILLYHVVGATALSTDLSDGQVIATINGADVIVTINGGVFINNAQVIAADIIADNGVVHVIDAVLLPPAEPTNTILDIVVNSDVHNTLEAAVLAAGLQDALAGPGPLTVFAPTDAAFAALPAGTLEALLADPTGALTEILLYHVVDATALSTDLFDGQVIATINGADVIVTINGGVFINNAQVIVADIIADNGVVHVIDAVLLPPVQPTSTIFEIILNSPDHTTLALAVLEAGLSDELSGPGPFTVFAPTDAAFAALPAGTLDVLLQEPTGELANILLYHVLDFQALSTDLVDGMIVTTLLGEEITVTINANGVFINDAQVTVADVLATNGVVHVIDAVLLPAPMPTNTIMDIVTNSADHNTLEAALVASGLNETLSTPGAFTLFAPTDAAFALLPAGTVDALLADASGELVNVLLYHVLAGTVLSTDLVDGMMAMTIQGSDVTVAINANGVFINNAQVIVADILAENGVVHVIDAVLLPAPSVEGCMASEACNFNAEATIDDASCVFPGEPCDDANDLTFDDVLGADCVCAGQLEGCTDMAACNYDLNAGIDNGSCLFAGDNCDDNNAATINDVYTVDCGCEGVVASNTVVDIIVNSPDHTTLETAVIAAELADDLSGPGPFTVFAPTDAAFAALPAGTVETLLADPTGALANILLYHVLGLQALSTDLVDGMMVTTLQGEEITVTINANGVFINDAQVTVADIAATNGVVHVIDAVLLPPVMPTNTIMDIVTNSEVHNTLEAALVASGLDATLSTPGSFTLFAPTDAAFALLPAGTVDALLADPTGELVNVLLYHVLSGTVLSTDLVDGMMAMTIQGSDVTVTINANGVFINNAQVIVADIMADNGVVHVIDAVLLPPAPPVEGCTAAEACNYNAAAEVEDGSCVFPGETCDDMNENTTNDILGDDCVCVGQMLGCTEMSACNYDMNAMVDNGSCQFPGDNCDDADPATINDVFTTDCGCAGIISNNTVVDIIVNSPDHTTLETAVILAGLADDLSATGPFTVFAPTDAAFAALPAGVLDAVLADPNGLLTQILLYHVVSGTALSTDLTDGMVVATLNGATVTVTIAGSNVIINDALVTVADIIADNGVVHVINAVLLPPAPQVEGCTAVEACNYNPEATIDDASCILPGEPCDDMNENTINDVLGADCVCAGDVLGCTDMTACNYDMNAAIDNGTCQFPGDACDDGNAVTTNDVYGLDCVCAGTSTSNTILDIVVNSADHNTLEAAVVAAGLQSALSGQGPLTVFAPTDGAFAALPAGTVDALLADPTGALTQVLLYHAVTGLALSTDLADGMMITTIQGQDVTVTINANGVFINDAQVIVADIIADNGVVHVIDAVLIPELNPEPTTVVDIIVNSANHTTLETAVIAAGLADDLSADGPFTVFAPTDAAFAALPAGVLDALLADPTGALAQVLLYHVVSGEALSSSLTNGQTITTLQGQDVTVSITGGNVFINNAQVVMADIMADNGVVHVIDAVLTPSTSVSEVNMNSTVVYPNPAAEQLTISMPAMNGSTVYSIYSVTGELVSTGNLYATTTSISVDNLSQGMYQLKVVNGTDCVSRSFMKK